MAEMVGQNSAASVRPDSVSVGVREAVLSLIGVAALSIGAALLFGRDLPLAAGALLAASSVAFLSLRLGALRRASAQREAALEDRVRSEHDAQQLVFDSMPA